MPSYVPKTLKDVVEMLSYEKGISSKDALPKLPDAEAICVVDTSYRNARNKFSRLSHYYDRVIDVRNKSEKKLLGLYKIYSITGTGIKFKRN